MEKRGSEAPGALTAARELQSEINTPPGD